MKKIQHACRSITELSAEILICAAYSHESLDENEIKKLETQLLLKHEFKESKSFTSSYDQKVVSVVTCMLRKSAKEVSKPICHRRSLSFLCVRQKL